MSYVYLGSKLIEQLNDIKNFQLMLPELNHPDKKSESAKAKSTQKYL